MFKGDLCNAVVWLWSACRTYVPRMFQRTQLQGTWGFYVRSAMLPNLRYLQTVQKTVQMKYFGPAGVGTRRAGWYESAEHCLQRSAQG